MTETSEHSAAPGSVAVIGAGNIGPHLIPHLARLPDVRRLVIVDPDSVRAENTSQEYSHRDIGQKKAIASARRAAYSPGRPTASRGDRRSRGECPLGTHSRRRDMHVCRFAAVPLVHQSDCVAAGCSFDRRGHSAPGIAARVEAHIPSFEAPCLECSWSRRDRELIGESYSCDGRLREPAPTGASSALGGLAASLQAMECQKILNRTIDQSLAGRQVIIEAGFHHYYVNVLRRNPACGFDHQVWAIQKAPDSVQTVGDLVEHGRKLFGGSFRPVWVWSAGRG